MVQSISIRKHSVISSILLAFLFSATHAQSYDCGQLQTPDQRCPMVPGPSVPYPTCLVTEFSVSAFIQCADLQGPNAPQYTVDSGTLSVLDVLSQALARPGCDSCPLAHRIQNAADDYTPGTGIFARWLCRQYHPIDAGICCLRNCIGGILQEHSIAEFCSDPLSDLMEVPLVPDSCKSNGQPAGSTNGNEPTGGDESSNDNSSIETGPSTTSLTPTPTSPPPSTPETPNAGADSKKQGTYTNHVRNFGSAVLSLWIFL